MAVSRISQTGQKKRWRPPGSAGELTALLRPLAGLKRGEGSEREKDKRDEGREREGKRRGRTWPPGFSS